MRGVIQANQFSKCISINLLFSTDQTHILTPVCLIFKKIEKKERKEGKKNPSHDKIANLLFGAAMSDRIKHLTRFSWQLHRSKFSPIVNTCITSEDSKFQLQSCTLFSIQQVLKLHCQPAELCLPCTSREEHG